MKGAVQTALMQNTQFFFTNLHETKIISLRNSDNYENEKKTLKQKINFHKTDKLKEFFNHKLIIILIFFKRIKLETFLFNFVGIIYNYQS